MIKCSECGKFHKPYDRGVPFGSVTSTEPPDEEMFCEKCSEKLEQYYVDKHWVPNYWLKPNWTRNVAKKLNLILISPVGASWSIWHLAKDSLPKGYIIC